MSKKIDVPFCVSILTPTEDIMSLERNTRYAMSIPNSEKMEREEVEMKILDMKNEGMMMRSMKCMYMVRDEVKEKNENDALILLKRDKLIRDKLIRDKLIQNIERRIEQNKMLKALETSGFSYVGGNMISIPKSVRSSREVYPKGSWWG